MWYATVDLAALNSGAAPESVAVCVDHLLTPGGSASASEARGSDAILRLLMAASLEKLPQATFEEQLATVVGSEALRRSLAEGYNRLHANGGPLADFAPSVQPPSGRVNAVEWKLMHAMGDRREAQRSIPLLEFSIPVAQGNRQGTSMTAGERVTFQCTPDEAAELLATLQSALRAPLRMGMQ